MTNKNNEPSENALLTEYLALGNYNNSFPSQYWMMTGIFIAFSSVLLGGLIYAFLSNKESLLLGVIICVISTAVLLILFFLWYWGKRVNFLQQTNFFRMHEIEAHLGMRGSMRIQSIDCFKNLEEELSKFKIDKEKKKSIKDELEEFSNEWKCKPNRERSSRWHYKGIFFTLIGMWILVLMGGITLLYFYCPSVMGISLGLLALIGVTIFFYRKNIWPFKEK